MHGDDYVQADRGRPSPQAGGDCESPESDSELCLGAGLPQTYLTFFGLIANYLILLSSGNLYGYKVSGIWEVGKKSKVEGRVIYCHLVVATLCVAHTNGNRGGAWLTQSKAFTVPST